MGSGGSSGRFWKRPTGLLSVRTMYRQAGISSGSWTGSIKPGGVSTCVITGKRRGFPISGRMRKFTRCGTSCAPIWTARPSRLTIFSGDRFRIRPWTGRIWTNFTGSPKLSQRTISIWKSVSFWRMNKSRGFPCTRRSVRIRNIVKQKQ